MNKKLLIIVLSVAVIAAATVVLLSFPRVSYRIGSISTPSPAIQFYPGIAAINFSLSHNKLSTMLERLIINCRPNTFGEDSYFIPELISIDLFSKNKVVYVSRVSRTPLNFEIESIESSNNYAYMLRFKEQYCEVEGVEPRRLFEIVDEEIVTQGIQESFESFGAFYNIVMINLLELLERLA